MSVLDAAGNKPTNLSTVQYVLYWRALDGRIYANASSITSNECTVSIPAGYMNPHTTVLHLDLWWTMTDGTQQLFATYTVNIEDVPSTATTTPAVSTAPRPLLFYSAGLPTAATPLGSVQWDPTQFGGSGTLSLPVLGCKESAPPTGSGIQVTLYAAGVATAYTWTLAAGASRETGSDSIAVTAGTVYTIYVNTVGSTYAGEDVYVSFLFTPSA